MLSVVIRMDFYCIVFQCFGRRRWPSAGKHEQFLIALENGSYADIYDKNGMKIGGHLGYFYSRNH